MELMGEEGAAQTNQLQRQTDVLPAVGQVVGQFQAEASRLISLCSTAAQQEQALSALRDITTPARNQR